MTRELGQVVAYRCGEVIKGMDNIVDYQTNNVVTDCGEPHLGQRAVRTGRTTTWPTSCSLGGCSYFFLFIISAYFSLLFSICPGYDSDTHGLTSACTLHKTGRTAPQNPRLLQRTTKCHN